MHLPGFGLEHSLDWPRVELAETDQHWKVTAELPGVESSDVEVLVTDRVITIRGEKIFKDRRLEKPCDWEFFGLFERRISLPGPIRLESVTAAFKAGVLNVVMVKAIDQQRSKRITVDA